MYSKCSGEHGPPRVSSEVLPLKSKIQFMWQEQRDGRRLEVRLWMGRTGAKGKAGRSSQEQLLLSEISALVVSLIQNAQFVEGSSPLGQDLRHIGNLNWMAFSFLGG